MSDTYTKRMRGRKMEVYNLVVSAIEDDCTKLSAEVTHLDPGKTIILRFRNEAGGPDYVQVSLKNLL